MSDDLDNEEEIVWTKPTDELDYVRASALLTGKKTGTLPENRTNGELIGYAVLHTDAEPDQINHTTPMYRRRYFWLKSSDRGRRGIAFENCAPAEAVDPRTVAPGVSGELTDRARGRE